MENNTENITQNNDENLSINVETTEESTLGEHMSECATNIKGQGFQTFLQARDAFLQKIENFQDELYQTTGINTYTHT